MKRFGIHSVYAISLLVIITIGMTGIVYNYMNASNNILSSNIEYAISTATLSGIQSGTLCWYHIILQNTGTKSFVHTNIILVINEATYNLLQNSTNIAPGQLIDEKGILNAQVVYGHSYTVRVSAVANDGSTFETSRQINAG